MTAEPLPTPSEPVPKSGASLESALRTLIQAAVGALVGYLGSRPADPNDRAWVMGLITAVVAALVAAGMRLVAPLQTDYRGKHVQGVKRAGPSPTV
jgi:hypothetical protein